MQRKPFTEKWVSYKKPSVCEIPSQPVTAQQRAGQNTISLRRQREERGGD